MTTTQKEPDYKSMRNKLITDNKLTLRADFIPFSQSRNNGKKWEKWESLNWTITLLKDSRVIVQTDYASGIAHIPNGVSNMPRSIYADNEIKMALEEGKYTKDFSLKTMDKYRAVKTPIPAPAIESVLYSLLLDSDVLDFGDFEEWAVSYGYDTDSIKAKKTYQQCLKIALSFRAKLGESLLGRLRESFTNY